MRLVQVTIPAGKRETVLEVLDEEGIDYVLTDETSGRKYTGVVYFPLPTNAVEPILEQLREEGLDRQAYTVVLKAETVVSEQFEDLSEEYAEREETDERIARQELRARAEELASSLPTYVVMTLLSGVIATAGLLLNSPATVVGSMVIAPLIGPAMTTATGSVLGESDLFRRGVILQVVGVVLAIMAATAFSIFVQVTNLVPPGLDPLQFSEVQERLSPNFLSLAVAIGAGVAGALSLMTGISVALVGVMIAVALIPPAATVGIGVAYGEPALALGSAVLTAGNVLSINLAALVVLWYGGYRPEHFFQRDRARLATIKRIAVLLAAIVVLSVFLGGVTYDSYRTASTEEDIRTTVEGVLEDPPYADYQLIEMEVETTTDYVLFQRPTDVILTVGVPPDSDRSPLASTVEQRLESEHGLDVDVQVLYFEMQTTDGEDGGEPGRGE